MHWDGPRQIETIGHLIYEQRAWELGTGLQTCIFFFQTCILNEGYDTELHLLLNEGIECFLNEIYAYELSQLFGPWMNESQTEVEPVGCWLTSQIMGDLWGYKKGLC